MTVSRPKPVAEPRAPRDRWVPTPGWRGWLNSYDGTWEPELPSERSDYRPQPGEPTVVRTWVPRPGLLGWLLGEGHWIQEVVPAVPVVPGRCYRHRKGGVYRVLHLGVQERDLQPQVIYKAVNSPDPRLWIRPLVQFADGRFQPLEAVREC